MINQDFLVCWILCPDLWKQSTFTFFEIRIECMEFIQNVQRYQQRVESDFRKKKGRGNPNTSPSPNTKVKGKIGDFRLWLSLILQRNSKVTLTHFFSSVTQSCLAHCDPMNHSTPGLPVHNQLPELKVMSIGSVMTSSHLILCCPFLLLPSIFPSIRVFSNESVLRIRWPKYWSFSFNISLSNEH